MHLGYKLNYRIRSFDLSNEQTKGIFVWTRVIQLTAFGVCAEGKNSFQSYLIYVVFSEKKNVDESETSSMIYKVCICRR